MNLNRKMQKMRKYLADNLILSDSWNYRIVAKTEIIYLYVCNSFRIKNNVRVHIRGLNLSRITCEKSPPLQNNFSKYATWEQRLRIFIEVSLKNYGSFSRYSSFCIFNHPMIYQICDVMVSIRTWDRVQIFL